MAALSGLLYGAASAAHQGDGGSHNTDWARWEAATARRRAIMAATIDYGQGKLKNLPEEAFDPQDYISGEAVDFWNRFETYLDLMQQIRLTTFRFSVEQSRIEPHRGQVDGEAVERVRQIAKACNARGIKPTVALWHFTHPLWAELKGGWESREVRRRFVTYALRMVEELHEEVEDWVTLNEPDTYAMMVYAPKYVLPTTWLNYPRGWRHFFSVRRRLVEVHHQTYTAIKARFPRANVGVELSFVYYDGWTDPVSSVVRKVMKSFSNDYFAPRLAEHVDWYGLHYYFHCRIKLLPFRNDFVRTSDLGWDLYPSGLRPLIEELWRFRKPILVEVGLADRADTYRWWYLKECLTNVYGAIRNDVGCFAFSVWAGTDSIELDKGRWGGRFGLVEIDYGSDLAPTIRPSAWRLRDHILHMKGV